MESEELFHGLAAKVAQEEKDAAAEKQRVQDLETAVLKRIATLEKEAATLKKEAATLKKESAALEKEAATREKEAATREKDTKRAIRDRVAESTAHLDANTDKIKAQGDSLKALGDNLKTYEGHVDDTVEKVTQLAAQLQNLQTQVIEANLAKVAQQADEEAKREARKEAKKTKKTAAPTPDPLIAIMKQEIDNLFADRDNMLVTQAEDKARITKLEENLRALTMQRSHSASPALTQRLPITAANGSQMDLSVPKGCMYTFV